MPGGALAESFPGESDLFWASCGPGPLYVPGYPPGPLTVCSFLLDSSLPSSVQMAPCPSQSVVTGLSTLTVEGYSHWAD